MQLSYLFVFAVIITVAEVRAESEPVMIWLSPRNVSSTSDDIAEVFPMTKGDWADLDTGAGSRSGMPVVHMDSKGTLWIMGGYTNAFNLNAMWNYDPVQDQYRWVAGNATYDGQYRNFGEMGVPSDDAFPGAPSYSCHAIDKNDNIWIYGNGGISDLNVMWMFNTTSLQFTWIGGDETNKNPTYDALGTASKDFWPGVLQGACTVVDSKNNIWMLGGYMQSYATNGVWHYNTTSHMWSLQWGDPASSITNPDYENKIWPGRWTPGCTIDENDRVWLFGGYSDTTPTNWNDMWSFDTKTVTWTVERETNETTLQGNVTIDGAFDINNYPSKRDSVNMIDRRDGTIMLFGGRDSDLGISLNDVWVFNKTSKLWKVVAGTPNDGKDVLHVYTQYRGTGSQLGSRQAYGSESGLNAKGHFIIVGGEHDVKPFIFNDIWIIPQDQCLTNLHNCDPNASCTMTSWSTYECTCNEGYTGDGKTCAAPPTIPVSAPVGSQPTSSTPTKKTSGTAANGPISFIMVLATFMYVIV